ncbi:MAG: hypothetical protein HKL95_06115 [Phycisphaerae bacterium]|nr:hypothetical protein [Phycisphaerae bacterium]
MPDNLHDSLQSVAQRQRSVRISLGVLRVLFVSLAVALAGVLLLGEFTHMALALRWVLALLVWVVPAGLCLLVLGPALRRVNLQTAASTMDALVPQSQELFLSAVEFAQKPPDPFMGSPQLVHHVINRASDDAHAVDPEQAVSTGKLIRWAGLCAPLVLAWAILWPLMPQTLALGVQRSVFPWLAAGGPAVSGHRHSGPVEQGPTITFFEKRYRFPAYTGLPERIIHDHNGAIHGLFGSHVQVIIHTTELLAVGSRLVVNSNAGPPDTLALTAYGPRTYQAKLVLTHNATYAVVLVNRDGVKTISKHPWPVTVDAAWPPTIHILTPALTVRVRPDDHVPVVFSATDSYGISAIRALVWTDGSSARSVNIALPPKPAKAIKSSWIMAVQSQLRTAGRADAHTIYYKLEALDNARPQAHFAMTARHELIVDAHLRHQYQTRQDNKLWRLLRKAIVQTLTAVKTGRTQVRPLVDWPRYRAVDPARKAAVADAATRVLRTGQSLAQEAKTLLASDFGTVAARAIRVARGPVYVAANDLARIGLAADQSRPISMPELARVGRMGLKRAQASLLRLLHALDQAKGRAALKNSLARLARRQHAIAQIFAHSGSRHPAYHDQQALSQQLQQLLRQHPSLQIPAAKHMAAQISQLAQQVATIVRRQAVENIDLHPAIVRQAQRSALEHLADQQQILNRHITRFNQRYKLMIAATSAQPVTPAMMQAVSRALESPGDAAVAREARNNIVQTLQAMARQLDRYAQQAGTPVAKQKSSQAQRDQASVNQLSRQVQAATAAVQQADAAQSPPRMVRTAATLRRQVRHMLNENPPGRERVNLLQARADANRAVEQVTHQSGGAAANLLQQAYHQLAKATGYQTQRLESQRRLAQQATEAAMGARALASRQATLAARTAAAHQKPRPQAVESIQHQTAATIARAIAQGRKLQQEARDGAPNVAEHLETALRQMQRADTAQAKAAVAQSTQDQQEAQIHQGQALAHMRVASREIAALAHSASRGTPWQHPAGTGSSATGSSQGRAGPTPSSTMTAVARHVQAALAAQAQALCGNAGAAVAAAQSLTRAWATLADALAGQPSAMASGNHGQPGSGSAQPSRPALARAPGSAGTGLAGPLSSTARVPPQVTALGMSPAEWEHLGPLQQLRLLNIARQKVPSGYRRIIRNYYLRIADLGTGQK